MHMVMYRWICFNNCTVLQKLTSQGKRDTLFNRHIQELKYTLKLNTVNDTENELFIIVFYSNHNFSVCELLFSITFKGFIGYVPDYYSSNFLEYIVMMLRSHCQEMVHIVISFIKPIQLLYYWITFCGIQYSHFLSLASRLLDVVLYLMNRHDDDLTRRMKIINRNLICLIKIITRHQLLFFSLKSHTGPQMTPN